MVAATGFGLRSWPDGFVTLSAGYTAEYYVRGSGEPLVVVPGLAGGTGILEPLVEALSQDFQVVSFELRGETSQICDRDYHFDRLTRDLLEFIEGLRLERPGILGLSFGGAITLDFASRWPHRLSFAAVQGAGPSHRVGAFAGVARRVLDRLLLPDNNPFVNQFFRLLVGNGGADSGAIDFVVEQCWRTDQSVMAHRFALLDEYDVTHKLERLRLPVLALTGESDVLACPSSLRAFESLAPDVESHVLAGAGHFAFVTHAKQVAQAVVDFRRGVLAKV